MSPRLAALALPLLLTAFLAACQSSGRYGTPPYAAAAAGVGVAGAVASRAAGGCWAQCLPGTVCNPANGLCERVEARPTPAAIVSAPAAPEAAPAGSAVPAVKHAPAGPRRAPVVSASYPPGHTYEVPPAPVADAGCESAVTDPNALSCESDASAPH
jgi:hypothetical protein